MNINKDLSNKRENYYKQKLQVDLLTKEPISLFDEWYKVAENNPEIKEANACTLSTIGKMLQPKSRIVLLKEYSDLGFTFYTNYSSQKSKDIFENPLVCLSFFWFDLERQIIILGKAEKVSEEQSSTYFKSRPKLSQLGAILSNQSSVIDLDYNFDQNLTELEQQYKNKEIEKPKDWGGFLVRPHSIEFWQGRPSRLHDRFRYTKEHNTWNLERLMP